jgi:hypothetical protein
MIWGSHSGGYEEFFCLVGYDVNFFFIWRYSPNLGLGLPPWNSLFYFSFLDVRQSVGLLGWVISLSQGLYLYTNTEKRTHTNTTHPIPWVRFEPTIAASERAKTVHALDRSATVTVISSSSPMKVIRCFGETCRLQLQSQTTIMKQVVSDVFRRNVGWLLTDYTALFPSSGSKNKPSKKPAWSRSHAICSSETFVSFQRITWRYIPEDRTHIMLGSFTLEQACRICIGK